MVLMPRGNQLGTLVPVVLSLLLLSSLAQSSPIEARLAQIEAGAKGHLGAAVITPHSGHYSRRNERFSLQSVMKMMVAMAALDQPTRMLWFDIQVYPVR
ncbi:MAG: hypothetical protein H7Y17_06965 [Chlorobia bacterium]|nr:hypothetical protein [Fimbriimonadaceae bacterium]